MHQKCVYKKKERAYLLCVCFYKHKAPHTHASEMCFYYPHAFVCGGFGTLFFSRFVRQNGSHI